MASHGRGPGQSLATGVPRRESGPFGLKQVGLSGAGGPCSPTNTGASDRYRARLTRLCSSRSTMLLASSPMPPPRAAGLAGLGMRPTASLEDFQQGGR
jgi:hypothetical protein